MKAGVDFDPASKGKLSTFGHAINLAWQAQLKTCEATGSSDVLWASNP